MMETKRLASLFENLYNGNPWIDVNLVATLKSISVGGATKRISPNCNSIWEIINHLIAWRMNVLQRVNGKVIGTPDNNYFENIIDTSEKAWVNTLKRLEDSQTSWINQLKEMKAEQFEKIYSANKMTYYEHIHVIIQHDAYHMGQIVLLAKLNKTI